MSRTPFLATLALLTLSACSHGEALDLPSWTATFPDGTTEPLVLPTNVEPHLAPARSSYVLHTEARIPEAWRGKPLALSILAFHARVALLWGSTELHDDAVTFIEREHSTGPHLWHVPASLTLTESVPVEMRVEYDTSRAAWIDAIPVLGPAPEGPPWFRFVRTFNAIAIPLGVVGALFLAITYGAVWLVDRKRAAHGWFALQAVSVLPVFVNASDIGQWALGPLASYPYIVVCVTVPCISATHFLHAHFRLPRPSPWWWLCAAACIPAAAMRWDPFHVAGGAKLSIAAVGIAGIGVFRPLMKLVRQPRPPMNAYAFLTIWCIAWIAVAAQAPELCGAGAPLGGLQTICIGLFVFECVQFVALAREHLASLQNAEARVRDLEGLADELRHQVAARSRDLRDALANTEGTLVPQRPAVGEVFDGRYRIVRELGAGAMGAVFEVERQSDTRRLALKVITGAVSGGAAARFAREAEIGARMKHPHLVAIVDVGVARNSTPFLVMEQVLGGSLESQRSRFGDVAWGLPLLAQVASALEALHVAGIVHRDLKPANVLLTDESSGVVAKVADFGISGFNDVSEADALAATVERASPGNGLTGTGAILGTPLYMAPECARGARSAGPASDVFSFGVLSYEVLTGRTPFQVPPVFHALSGHESPPPDLLGEDAVRLGSEISLVIMECLSFDPSARPDPRRVGATLRGLAR